MNYSDVKHKRHKVKYRMDQQVCPVETPSGNPPWGVSTSTRVKHNSEGCEKLEKVAIDSIVK